MEKQRRYDTIERRNYKFLLNIFNNTEYSEANWNIFMHLVWNRKAFDQIYLYKQINLQKF